jgi:hypothetical protein
MTRYAQARGEVKSRLQEIIDDSWALMERECGGTGTGMTNGVSLHSWGKEMRGYMLTFL